MCCDLKDSVECFRYCPAELDLFRGNLKKSLGKPCMSRLKFKPSFYVGENCDLGYEESSRDCIHSEMLDAFTKGFLCNTPEQVI